jgi:hypothetical protein
MLKVWRCMTCSCMMEVPDDSFRRPGEQDVDHATYGQREALPCCACGITQQMEFTLMTPSAAAPHLINALGQRRFPNAGAASAVPTATVLTGAASMGAMHNGGFGLVSGTVVAAFPPPAHVAQAHVVAPSAVMYSPPAAVTADSLAYRPPPHSHQVQQPQAPPVAHQHGAVSNHFPAGPPPGSTSTSTAASPFVVPTAASAQAQGTTPASPTAGSPNVASRRAALPNDQQLEAMTDTELHQWVEALRIATAQAESVLSDRRRCIVCLHSERRVLLLPCRHLVMCEECSAKVTQTCPMCTASIESKVVAFAS